MFAEKALVAVGTIKTAEAGRTISARTHKALLDAINKARLSSVPRQDPLTHPFPGMAPVDPREPIAAEPEVPQTEAPSPPATGAKRLKELLGARPPPVPSVRRDKPPRLSWDDNEPVLNLAGDLWTTRDALEGTMIFGATGAGKTSGSGQALAKGYLTREFGGLVLCAKPDEADRWAQYAAATGRTDDILFFGQDPRLTFNFLAHEASLESSGGNLTENLVTLFTEIASIGSGSTAGKAADPFWERAMRSLVRNALELLVQAGEDITLHDLFDVIRSAPVTTQQVQEESWQQHSACWKMILVARSRSANTLKEVDLAEVTSFWLEQFPSLGDRTRSSVVATFTTLAEGLMRGRMRELFCSGTTLTPKALLQGKIIIIDLPIKEWGEIGRIAGVLWKYCTQKAIERRDDNKEGQACPVFIWADECRYFLSRNDDIFQATARSARAATVYLSQSISSLITSLGGEGDGRAHVDSLINNLGTKVFHSNGDPTTNEYAANLIGKRLTLFQNSSNSTSWTGIRPTTSSSKGYSTQFEYTWRPERFLTLQKGGPQSGFKVQAVIVQTGRTWGSEKLPYTFCTFNQRIETAPPPPLARGSNIKKRIAMGMAGIFCLMIVGELTIFAPGPSNADSRHTGVADAEISPANSNVSIPVEVRFFSNFDHGKAGIVNLGSRRLQIEVKIRSQQSGTTRRFNLELPTSTIVPLGLGDQGDLKDGDEVEVSSVGTKSITATYRSSLKPE